jgi:hypothetical protein
MSDQVKYLLDETNIPKDWYNIIADLPQPPAPVCIPARCSRSAPPISSRCSHWHVRGMRSTQEPRQDLL